METTRLARIADCAAAQFKPVLGDLDPLNLVLFSGYALAAILALIVVMRRPFPAPSLRRETAIWAVALVVLVFLTANKELDLQGWITATGRCLARAEGWYADRRAVQFRFILLLLACTGVLALALFAALRGTWTRSALPFFGFVLLFGFIGLRAISFHHVDQMLATEVANVRLHRLLEAAGLILIVLGEVLILWPRRKAPGPPRPA